ncbi:hypothetical protein BDZ90DRAFT_159932 [Jaminaea rosea]|uniref:Uncharacterized protein n=1 Tax=Jaminaea rosea TaxID=1569628 RepID=A0A316URS0_9BASI|nr:hypothetical protein BDZ90DRAFT_159932 [Jaminaea rosea]PWN28009.1 hypothetical protein BDZ90DRAFT_159932 [Jaminaea rosea]
MADTRCCLRCSSSRTPYPPSRMMVHITWSMTPMTCRPVRSSSHCSVQHYLSPLLDYHAGTASNTSFVINTSPPFTSPLPPSRRLTVCPIFTRPPPPSHFQTLAPTPRRPDAPTPLRLCYSLASLADEEEREGSEEATGERRAINTLHESRSLEEARVA